MLLNSQAFVSTLIYVALLLVMSIGSSILTLHHWWPMKLVGLIVTVLALALIVSHTVALIVGG